MKFLLVPGNNSLSHVAKCLAIEETLSARGHEVLVAVSARHSRFLNALSLKHCILPDIQETDQSGHPTVEWFRRPQIIEDCINAEIELLRQFKPDRVLGVFRFTIKIASEIAGVPYDSLVCGCMIPDSREVLGFAEGEPGRDTQQTILESFYQYGGTKISHHNRSRCVHTMSDMRYLLKGSRTFLWDFPEFLPLPSDEEIVHVGPIAWGRWPYDKVNIPEVAGSGYPLAVVAFGTCVANIDVMKRIVRLLRELGYEVLIAGGGQKELLNMCDNEKRVSMYEYAPLQMILPHASLVVSHGGQMTVFEALQSSTPVLVMPFQPEQAHSGVCLERMGCGARLIPPQPFQGDPAVYINAFNRMTDNEIKSKILRLTGNPQIKDRLSAVSEIIHQYRGAEQLASMLEDA